MYCNPNLADVGAAIVITFHQCLPQGLERGEPAITRQCASLVNAECCIVSKP